MHFNVKRFIQYGISLVLAVALMWNVFEKVNPGELVSKLQEADYRWIVLSSAISVVAYWSRAKRWCLLIEPLGYQPAVFHSFLALMAGYFVNLFLPRVGEVTRCGVLHKLEKVPVNISFGTVVAERIFDVIMLFILLCFTFVLEFKRLGHILQELLRSKLTPLYHALQNTATVVTLLISGVVLIGIVVTLFLVYKKAFQKNKLYLKLVEFFQGMGEGLLSVRKMRNPTAFFFHTILIWVMYYFMSYVLFFSMPQTAGLGIRAGFTILIMGGLGMSAPVQGGIGAFHVLVGNALVLYGLSLKDGIVLATFMHASQFLFTLLIGGLSLLAVLFIQRKKPVVEMSR